MNLEFRGRGHFYNLYSQGVKTGTVVTEAQFDCRVQKCPFTTFARHITSDGVLAVGGGIATTFKLPEKVHPTGKFTSQHAATLRKMATVWVTSNPGTPPYKKALRQIIDQQDATAFFTGTYTEDGKVMLIGNWVIGSMNDQHYGADDEIYESLLIIAEQQNDGRFRLASGSGSISDSGCSYFDHLDIDGDGVDEIFLQCAQLEGSYSYEYLKRVNGKWLTPPFSPKQQ